MERGAIVTYKDFSRKQNAVCGIIDGPVKDKPDYVLVRWLGNSFQSEESICDLEEV